VCQENFEKKMKTANYQICVTYRCNLHCQYCFQLFDHLPCGDADSDVTAEDVEAYRAQLSAEAEMGGVA
jgi:molybdenum cofactor biosynthesis enzyme MoaA